jgi:hypothetical protein
MARKKVVDPEVNAMGSMAGLMEPLDGQARRRVVVWMMARYLGWEIGSSADEGPEVEATNIHADGTEAPMRQPSFNIG